MVLLTSAQVSVAISSAIVFFFTTALFLSGYVLQQQTVRDLRAAIKPQLQRSKTAPDLFLPTLNEDGYLVDMVQIETRPVEQDVTEQVVEVSESERTRTEEAPDTENDDMVGATRWQKAARRKKLEEQAQQAKGAQKPIVENPNKQSPQEKPKIKSKPKEKPMSRAERRKKIKEQIVAEGQGETFKGYRRRMW
ncbi:hypothetical protein ONS95_004267 [Cadophora gregata]|uniref:uncharacterized protein n=1 Tax=Cadophora gregata TaxID=51156 RepID=UPI0026DBEC71|nr:uncharacterized protein ONS95_004267 [Cadophora gregata]KAK0105748.1 hypothetical protein ONS95_004267 [Cadophora gregata]